MCVGLNQGGKTHTIAEFLKASFIDNGNINNCAVININVGSKGNGTMNNLNLPSNKSNQIITKKQCLANPESKQLVVNE